MAIDPAQLKDDELLYGFLPEYLDDELPKNVEGRFKEALAKKQKPELGEHFSQARGHFQIALQDYGLGEHEIQALHQLVEDDAARATHEAKNIETVGRSELVGNTLRRIALIGGLLVVVFVGVYTLTPEREVPFKPLETITYEAIAMEEDPEGRLDFPTSDLGEVLGYFRQYPDFGFTPYELKPFSGEKWQVEGATIIDYEVAKIAAVQYGATGEAEKLFVFMFEGTLSQLPKSEPGNYQGLLYQTYASNKVNVIVWQLTDTVVGMMVGHDGAEELARLAKVASGI